MTPQEITNALAHPDKWIERWKKNEAEREIYTHSVYHALVPVIERELNLEPCSAIKIANQVIAAVEKNLPQFVSEYFEMNRAEIGKRREAEERITELEVLVSEDAREIIDLKAKLAEENINADIHYRVSEAQVEELKRLRVELKASRDLLKEHEAESWCFNKEHCEIHRLKREAKENAADIERLRTALEEECPPQVGTKLCASKRRALAALSPAAPAEPKP